MYLAWNQSFWNCKINQTEFAYLYYTIQSPFAIKQSGLEYYG